MNSTVTGTPPAASAVTSCGRRELPLAGAGNEPVPAPQGDRGSHLAQQHSIVPSLRNTVQCQPLLQRRLLLPTCEPHASTVSKLHAVAARCMPACLVHLGAHTVASCWPPRLHQTASEGRSCGARTYAAFSPMVPAPLHSTNQCTRARRKPSSAGCCRG